MWRPWPSWKGASRKSLPNAIKLEEARRQRQLHRQEAFVPLTGDSSPPGGVTLIRPVERKPALLESNRAER
jgi:hypothetical protein